jgi:hypothetical protein
VYRSTLLPWSELKPRRWRGSHFGELVKARKRSAGAPGAEPWLRSNCGSNKRKTRIPLGGELVVFERGFQPRLAGARSMDRESRAHSPLGAKQGLRQQRHQLAPGSISSGGGPHPDFWEIAFVTVWASLRPVL